MMSYILYYVQCPWPCLRVARSDGAVISEVKRFELLRKEGGGMGKRAFTPLHIFHLNLAERLSELVE